ncbi:Hypothetical protein GLP15_374 [Giardia lamblia P15]|uniref:Uncharacterized protein n=1 Tax=Giardia intestinalis (strain P15) TaxID=658858 RepID=E1EXR4_GIAIA|nr:Hypothetical protein GLP15_374 [Giardia lamblia P15]
MSLNQDRTRKMRQREAENKVAVLMSSIDQVKYMKIDVETVAQLSLILAVFLGITCITTGAEKASWLTLLLVIIYHNHRPLDMPSALVVIGPLCVIFSSLNWSMFKR